MNRTPQTRARRFAGELVGFLNRRSQVQILTGPPSLLPSVQTIAVAALESDATFARIGFRRSLLKLALGFLIIIAAILFFLFVCGGIAGCAAAEELPNAPYVVCRRPVELYSLNERLTVHNSPSSLHHNWIARHPRIFGAIVIGAGAGIGAGISLSQRRGICQGMYENQFYYGTSPCPQGTTRGRQ